MSRPDARERIVDAAVARLHERGLTVALDGISLEEAIAEAGVARATGYRRWPNRTEFTREVLVRVVRAARLEPESEEDLGAIRALFGRHRDRLDSPGGRRTTVVEALRVATAADHRRLSSSREWRDYLALRVTCQGLPDEELRNELTAALRATEQEFVRHRASVYAQIAELFGYRPTTPVPGEDGFALVAEITGALMTGLILDAAADHDQQATRTFRARAFGSEVEADWTTASYALTAALLTNLAPDPDADWDPDRALAHLDTMIPR